MGSIQRLCVVLGSAFLLLVSGCWRGDFAKTLPNGYELIRTNYYTTMIWTPRVGGERECIVPPDIQEIAIHRQYVFGWLVSSPRSDKGSESIPGFFVLDTSTGETLLGLDEDDWNARMRQVGVQFASSLLRHPRRL